MWLCRAVPSFHCYFKTLSIGWAPGIEPIASCSEVNRSAYLAYPYGGYVEFHIPLKTPVLVLKN